VLLPLAGCSADEPVPAVASRAPVAAPTATTSAPVTPSPTTPTSVATVSLPAPTFRPEGTFNEDDAIGFAAYYLQVLNHARATGDPSLLRSISEADCVTCQSMADTIDEYRVRGYRWVNPDLRFDEATIPYFETRTKEADIDLLVDTDAGQIVDASGTVLGNSPAAERSPLPVQIHLRDGQWYIQQLP